MYFHVTYYKSQCYMKDVTQTEVLGKVRHKFFSKKIMGKTLA